MLYSLSSERLVDIKITKFYAGKVTTFLITGAQPLLKAVTAPPPPLEKLGHNYYILSKTYFLSIQKLNE
jgi:hypothetical protein